MLNNLQKFLDKAGEILSTAYGWAAATVVFMINLLCDFVAGKESIIFILLFVVIMDAVWGIWRAVKDDACTTSAMMRESLAKLAVYGSLVLVFIGLDNIIGSNDGVTTIAASSLIVLTEAWSILANAIIVFPNMPFAKVLKLFVSGEIASKLGCSKEDVDKTLGKRYTKRKKNA